MPMDTSWFRQQAEEIVERGKDVREGIAKLAAGATERLHDARDGLVGMCRAVLDGAVAGAQRAVPARRESVLREVVAGLADGLGIGAKALELTVREAGSRGKRFAREDLDKAAADLRRVGDEFAATVGDAAKRLSAQVSGQLADLKTHAQNTIAQVGPALQAAISAAAEHPVKLGAEAAKAGASAAREVAGVLFSELGRRLEQAGKMLKRQPE